MIQDKEIWACANQVLRQYGDAAWFHATQRADELFAAGDREGQSVWLRILRRIEQLEQIKPDARIH